MSPPTRVVLYVYQVLVDVVEYTYVVDVNIRF